jgi:hypothetical protein
VATRLRTVRSATATPLLRTQGEQPGPRPLIERSAGTGSVQCHAVWYLGFGASSLPGPCVEASERDGHTSLWRVTAPRTSRPLRLSTVPRY